MQVIKCDLPAEHKEIEIHPLADFHIGDAHCDFRHIQKMLKHIEETPNAYATLGGDMMDTAIASSVGDTYGASLTPMEQLKQCVAIFEPIKDKILCILGGNHENRIYKMDGIDITGLMAAQLGLQGKYSPTTAFLFVRFGQNADRSCRGRKMCYTGYVTHGSGGGRKEGGKINRLADYATICDADFYISAHTHLPAVFKTGYYRVDASNNTVSYVDKLFVNTASALGYDGYGDKQGYKPSSKDNPVIILNGSRKKTTAKL